MIRKLFGSFVILTFLAGVIGYNPLIATAAQFSGVKDTMSTQLINTTADHVITATLVGGDTFATGETLTYDFTDADFTLNAISNWQTSDFTFNDGTLRSVATVSTVSGTPPACTAGVNNVSVTINTTTDNFVVTACGTYTPSSANAVTTFSILGATGGTGTMTNKTTDIDSSLFTITESNGDTARGAVVAETNGVVNITATVNPTLTFSNDDPTVGFGVLSSGAATYANGAATGAASDSANAHTLTVGTNAPSGYTVAYNGDTLKNGANSIAAATIAGSATGTPGSAQFAMSATVTGTGTVASGYNHATPDWKYVVNTPTTLASASAPASSDTIGVRYLANIPASQTAGTYSTNVTFTVAGNF